MPDFEESRRQFLLQLLATGAFTSMSSNLLMTRNVWAENNELPAQLESGRSIFRLKGDVTINGVPATLNSIITANDKIETGDRSFIIFVVGQDAFTLRSNSVLKLSPGDTTDSESSIKTNLVNSLRLVSGKLLSVFGKSGHTISTYTATIGIRGTGVYVESNEDESYVCTCYGTTLLSANNDPNSSEVVTSEHHDAPRYITSSGSEGQYIRPAPFKNHEDIELLLLEELVGRETPFPVPDRGRRSSLRSY